MNSKSCFPITFPSLGVCADLHSPSGESYFIDFLNLPPRSLKEYFDVIAEPMSLKALQKQVRGQRGRSAATGVSEFKSWSLFEDQAGLIWKNAYHFNEDGSPIYQLAQELEVGSQQD